MKFTKKILALSLVILIIFSAQISTFATAANVSLSGPASVQSGSTVSFSVQVSQSEGVSGFSANISTSSGLVVQSVRGCPSGWLNSSNNNKIAMAGTNAVRGFEIIITCKITGNVGEVKTISLSDVNSSDAGGSDFGCSNVSRNITIAAAPSSDNNLASLTVSNATLSPAFSPSRTSYDCGTVPYSVSKLNVSATASDKGARVSIGGTNLVVGKNTISVVVTAASGAKKTYSITVTREQDPNYVPSNNANVAGLTPSAGQISPAFSADRSNYVIYVPFEVTSFSITGAAQDAKASVTPVENAQLEVGKNDLNVVCTAEDGTQKTYVVSVVRMSEYAKEGDIILPETMNDEPLDDSAEVSAQETQKPGISLWIVIVIGVCSLAVGVATGVLINRKTVKRSKNGNESSEDSNDIDS